MKIIRANDGSRSALPPDLVLNCHKTYSGHNDVYGIMDPDKPAPTMTGGCLSYSKGRFGHPFEDRAISVREAARMGCPAVSVNVIYGWIVCWICNFNYCGLHVNNCCIFRVRLIEILHRYVII